MDHNSQDFFNHNYLNNSKIEEDSMNNNQKKTPNQSFNFDNTNHPEADESSSIREGSIERDNEKENFQEKKRIQLEDEELELSEKEHKNYCEICYSTSSENFLQTDLSQFLKLIYCQKCSASAHLVCYGIGTEIEEITDHNNNTFISFICDRCKHQTSHSDLTCYVCGLGEGCLRQTIDNKWMHPVCGLASHNVRYEDVITMAIDLSSFRKESQKLKSIRKCDICKTKVETVKCINKDVSKYCHLHCALRAALLSSQKKSWEISFAVQPNPKFSSTSYFDEAGVLANIEDMALELKEILIKYKDVEEENIVRSLKHKKGPRGKATTKRVDREDPCVSGFLNEILEETKITTMEFFQNDELNSSKDVIEDCIRHMGGEILLNFIDRGDSTKKLSNTSKALRDALKNDLHKPEMNDEMIRNILSSLCKELYEQEQVDTKDFPIINNASLPEILVLANLLKHRIEVVLHNFCSLEDIQDLINCIKKLPFPLGTLIKNINERVYSSLATDLLLKDVISACKPLSLCDKSTPKNKKLTLNEEAMNKNTELLSIVEQLQSLYEEKKYTRIKTPGYQALLQLKEQLFFLQELQKEMYNFHKNSETPQKQPLEPFIRKLSPSLTKELYTKAVDLGIDNQMEEIKALQTQSRARTPTSSAKKVYNTRHSSAKKSVENILTTPPKVSSKKIIEIKSEPRGDSHRRNAKDSIIKVSSAKSTGSKSTRKSPLKFSISKKGPGRPQKEENMLLDIERDYEERLRSIQEKIDLDVIQENLKSYREQGEEQPEIKIFEEALEKIFDWKKRYEQALEENNGGLKEIVEEIDLMEIKLPEMEEAVDYQRKYWIWKSKMTTMGRKLKKRRVNIFDMTDDVVEFEDFEELIKEGEEDIKKFETSADEDFEELKEKLDKVIFIQAGLKKMGSSSWKLNDLLDIEKELKGINIRFDELLLLKDALKENEVAIPEKVMEIEYEKAPHVSVKSSLKSKTSPIKISKFSPSSSAKKTPKSVQFLDDDSNKKSTKKTIEIEDDEIESLRKDLTEEDVVETWKNEVKSVLGRNPEETISQLLERTGENEDYDINQVKNELEDFKRLCSRLLNAYWNGLRDEANLEKESRQLQDMIQWITWVIQALSMKQQVEEDKDPLTYGEIKLAVEKMGEIGLRDDIGLCKVVKEWFDKAENLKREFRRGYDYVKKRVILEKKNSEGGGSQFRIDQIEARRILDLLKGAGNFVKFTQEIDVISEDLKNYDDWTSKVQDFCNDYDYLLDVKNDNNDELRLKKDRIFRQLENLKEDSQVLVIDAKTHEIELKTFEWAFEATLVIKKIKRENVKKIIHEGQQLQAERANFAKIEIILNVLKAEMGNVDKVREFVENVKKFERGVTNEKQSYEDLVTMMSEIKGKRDSFGLEFRVIEDLYIKSGKIQDDVFKILQTEKSKKQDIPEFTKLQNEIKKFPVDMKEEQQHLEKALDKGNKLFLEIKKTLFPTYQEMETLVLKYKKCPVFIKKADELEKQFEDLKKSYEKIITEGKRMNMGICRLGFDELGDLSAKIDKVLEYKSDEENLLKKYKKDFFAKRCEILQRGESDVLLTFTALKNLFMDLPTYKNEFRKDNQLPQLEEIREFLEHQNRIAGDIANEIKRLRDKDSVAKFPAVHRFVDFTLELAEKRADFIDVSAVSTPLRFLDNFSFEREESKDPAKKKRGRPPKADPLEYASQASREASRLSREDERDREKSQDLLFRRKNSPPLKDKMGRDKVIPSVQRPLKDSLLVKSTAPVIPNKTKELEKRPSSQKTSTGKGKEVKSKRETVTEALVKVLESSRIPGLGHNESSWIAKQIIQTFPDLLVYNDTLTSVSESLRNVLRFKHIGQNLLEKKFESASLRSIMAKSTDDLVNMEKDLKKDEAESLAIKKKSMKSGTENDLKNLLPTTEKPVSAFASLKFNDTKKSSLDQKSPLLNLLQKSDISNLPQKVIKKTEVPSLSSLESETFSDDGFDCQEITPPLPLPIIVQKKTVPAPGPILYDPDNPTKENRSFDSPVLYDPDMPREIPPPIKKIEHVPEDTILKIFEDILKCGKDNTYPQASLFTLNSFDLENSIPDGMHCSLKIAGKISLDRFRAYINKSLNTWEKKGEKIISGWVESHIPHYQACCDKIAQDLADISKVGVLEYNESSKIFFLNRQHFPRDWERPLGLNIRKTQFKSNPSLCYILYQKPAKLTKNAQPISAEVIPVIDNSWKDTNANISPTWSQTSKEDFAGYQNQQRNPLHRPVVVESLNQKRGYQQMNDISFHQSQNQNSGSKNDPRLIDRNSSSSLPIMEDPRKRLKLSNADKMGSSLINVNYIEKETAAEASSGINPDDEEFMKKLSGMSDSELAAFVQNLDLKTRKQIMSKLKILADEKASTKKEDTNTEVSIEIEAPQDLSSNRHYLSQSQSQKMPFIRSKPTFQNDSLVYNPPDFIQAFYKLFSKEELEEAKERAHQDSFFKFPEPKLNFNQNKKPFNLNNSFRQKFNSFPSSQPTKMSPPVAAEQPWNNSFNNTQDQNQNKPFSPVGKIFQIDNTSSSSQILQQSPQFMNENLLPRIEFPTNPIMINNQELFKPKPKQSPPLSMPMFQIEKPTTEPAGYESPPAKNLDEKKTEERQSTPDFPKAVSRTNETTTTPFETRDTPIPVQLFRTPEPNTGRNELLGNVSFTLDSNHTSFGDDVFVPSRDVKVRNFNSILMEEELSPEGKSTVDTHGQRMSVESSTNKEEIAALLLKSNFSKNNDSVHKINVTSAPLFFNNRVPQEPSSPVKTETFGLCASTSSEDFAAIKLPVFGFSSQDPLNDSDEFKAAMMSAPKLEQGFANNENVNPYNKAPKLPSTNSSLESKTGSGGMMLGKNVVINKDQMTIPKELYDSIMGNTNNLLSGFSGQIKTPQLTQNNPTKVKQETPFEQSQSTPTSDEFSQQQQKNYQQTINLIQQLQGKPNSSTENKQPNTLTATTAPAGNKGPVINLKGLHQLTNLLALAKNNQLAANKK